MNEQTLRYGLQDSIDAIRRRSIESDSETLNTLVIEWLVDQLVRAELLNYSLSERLAYSFVSWSDPYHE